MVDYVMDFNLTFNNLLFDDTWIIDNNHRYNVHDFKI